MTASDAMLHDAITTPDRITVGWGDGHGYGHNNGMGWGRGDGEAAGSLMPGSTMDLSGNPMRRTFKDPTPIDIRTP